MLSAPGCSNESAAGAPGQPEQAGVPNVVPYLDNHPSEIDGQGTAVATPSGPLPIGAFENFEITFTVGDAGVAPEGFVMLQVSAWWGWSVPQDTYEGAPGYTLVKTGSEVPFNVHILPLNRVVVAPGRDGFAPGEKIIFSYSGHADKFAESEELFQIFVDADGDGHSACIAEPPTIRTIARAPTRLHVTAPSLVKPGEAIEVRAAALDGLGNWAEFPAGTYALEVTRADDPVNTPAEKSEDKPADKPADKTSGKQHIEITGGEKTISFNHTISDEGIYFFDVTGPSLLFGRSNVTLSQEGEPSLDLYFGDIHGHSRISDGTGTPEDFYRFAREVSRLDIAALTDHADYGTIPVKGAVWERIKKAASDAYEPGRFVTFLAFEWTSWVFGHRNVYYRDGDGPIFRSIDPESDTPKKIWKILEPFEAMTVAHHVGGGPIATDWSVEPSASKEWLVEICSIHGSSEYYGGRSMIYNPKRGAFARDALARGYRLGIIAAGDTHDGHPGRRSSGAMVNGLVAVYSADLTREAVWDAFRSRRVYGTSGPKIILNFRVADSPMGSEVKWSASKGPLPIAVRVVGCDEIEAIEIVRNGEPVFAMQGGGIFAQFLVEDPEPPEGESWYYARVIQKDGNMAWSSPIWVTVDAAKKMENTNHTNENGR